MSKIFLAVALTVTLAIGMVFMMQPAAADCAYHQKIAAAKVADCSGADCTASKPMMSHVAKTETAESAAVVVACNGSDCSASQPRAASAPIRLQVPLVKVSQ